MKRNEDSLRDLWDNIKCNNIHIIEVPEGEEREKGPENIFEDITAENFPNLGRIQEVEIVPNRTNSKRTIPRYAVIKMQKLKTKKNY